MANPYVTDISPITNLLQSMTQDKRQQQQQSNLAGLLGQARGGDATALNQLLAQNTQLGGFALKEQQAQQAAMQKQQDEQEALVLNRIIRSDDEQAIAIAQQAYDQGLFDDEDMGALFSSGGAQGPGQAMAIDRMSAVDGIKALGYEDLLPNEFKEGSGRYGRAIAGVDASGNEVFFQTDSNGNVSIVDGITPQGIKDKEDKKTDALVEREKKLNSSKNKLQLQEIDILKKQLDLEQKERMQGAKDREVQSQIDLGNTILNSDLNKIFGRGEEFYPDLLRSQDGIDMKANVNQFVGQLKLAAAGKMKGQGSVSDSERKTLNDAATVLSNPNISPELARKSLQNAVLAIQATMDGNQAQTPQPGGAGSAGAVNSSPKVKFLGFEE